MRSAATTLGLALTLAVSGCSSAPNRSRLDTTALQRALDDGRAAADVRGVAAAVLIPDGEIWSGASGDADVGEGIRASTDTLFALASVTKTYVAALVLDLAEEGVLGLDDPLERWVPDFPRARGRTIRALLGHTSGVGGLARDDPSPDPATQRSGEELAALVGRPPCRPSRCFFYSDQNYELLGLAVRAATGNDPATEIRRRLLEPLDLRDTFLQGLEPVPRPIAHVYDEDGSDTWDGSPYVPSALFASLGAAGAMVSTATDLARWGAALFGGRALEPASLQQMLDFERTARLQCARCIGYGLGINRTYPGGREAWGHEGSTGALLAYFPETNVAIAVLTNRHVNDTRPGPTPIMLRLMDAIPSLRARADVYTVRADGSDLRRITDDVGIEAPVSWSPDGSKLLFNSDRYGDNDLSVMNGDGSGPRRLTPGSGIVGTSAWSPDGGAIAFARSVGGTTRLFLMAPDGSNVRELPGTMDGDSLPAWSPDGTRIALANGGEGVRDVLVIRVGEGGFAPPDRVVVAGGPGDQWWPAWSADGTRLAFVSDGAIHVVEAAGGESGRISPRDRPARFPAWSSTNLIAFQSRGDLFVIEPDGSGIRTLVSHPAEEFSPVWSPDGSLVAFNSNRS